MSSAHQSHSVASPHSPSGGHGKKKYSKRFVGEGKDMERSLSDYHHGPNRLKPEEGNEK